MGVFGWVSWASFWFNWASIESFGWLASLLSQALESQKCPPSQAQIESPGWCFFWSQARIGLLRVSLHRSNFAPTRLTIPSLLCHRRSPPRSPASWSSSSRPPRRQIPLPPRRWPRAWQRTSCGGRSTEYPRVCETTLVPCAAAGASGAGGGRRPRAQLLRLHPRRRQQRRGDEGLRGASARRGGPVAAVRAGDGADGPRRHPRFARSLSNVQTGASAALTDTSTCLDSLAQHKARGRGGKGSDSDGDAGEEEGGRRRAEEEALKDVDLLEPEFRERITVIGAVQHELERFFFIDAHQLFDKMLHWR
ncbi:LOW QUALITY PROTEIN: hypothetical protein BDA96_07G225600 [Sorghum bicolor]|uniref:Uncharacterized protein n=1 Tax=Sorghum bicolor TaxID=4558 RepID=A0A921QM88_SORBI|nr:LOW QUALITY PROTEIN: hypothetical protein BDA96_07G225600 [Sorghum bicolor]